MQDEACGNTHMSPWSLRNLSLGILDDLTDSDFSETASEMLKFLTTDQLEVSEESIGSVVPATIVVCSPFLDMSGRPVDISGAQVRTCFVQ